MEKGFAGRERVGPSSRVPVVACLPHAPVRQCVERCMTDGEKKLIARRVGVLVQEKRKARGETATDVAARIGIARPNYRRFEKGTHMPHLDTLIRVARALECSATEILAEALKGIS